MISICLTNTPTSCLRQAPCLLTPQTRLCLALEQSHEHFLNVINQSLPVSQSYVTELVPASSITSGVLLRACCRYTRRRPDRTHGGVLNVHMGSFPRAKLHHTPHVHTTHNTTRTHRHNPHNNTQQHTITHNTTCTHTTPTPNTTAHTHAQPTQRTRTSHHTKTQTQHIFIYNCNDCNACNACNFYADVLFFDLI